MGNENRKILFVIPDEREVYKNVNIKVGAFHLPSLAFAILGAIAKKNRYVPSLLDLTIEESPGKKLRQYLHEVAPKYVGITCTSATYYQAIEIAKIAKEALPEIKVLIGGPHVSSLIDETLSEKCFDYVFVGESDIAFDAFLKGNDLETIEGIAFKDFASGNIHYFPNKTFIENLDDFIIPDYTLYDLPKYELSKLHARGNPVVWIESSRGCPFNCQICNKAVHGQTFRAKSATRFIAEIEYFLRMGIKEFYITDDGFSSDMQRAEDICDQIIKRGLVFNWACVNGIRADRASKSLLKKMKLAGCYRISFGIESGNQKVLENLGKRIKLEQIRESIMLAKEAGLEVFGFFIFGFEDDTKETMMDTIKFARGLPLDLAKASFMMPFPGSPLFEKYKSRNLIYPIKNNYRYFNIYIPPILVYRHPRLDWSLVKECQERFYRSFYFNPSYILRRCRHTLRNGTLLNDMRVVFQMSWFRGVKNSETINFLLNRFF